MHSHSPHPPNTHTHSLESCYVTSGVVLVWWALSQQSPLRSQSIMESVCRYNWLSFIKRSRRSEMKKKVKKRRRKQLKKLEVSAEYRAVRGEKWPLECYWVCYWVCSLVVRSCSKGLPASPHRRWIFTTLNDFNRLRKDELRKTDDGWRLHSLPNSRP